MRGRLLGEQQTQFGPLYFDGKGAGSPEVVKKRGSLVSDGTSPEELEGLVEELSGCRQPPSQFFREFFQELRCLFFFGRFVRCIPKY